MRNPIKLILKTVLSMILICMFVHLTIDLQEYHAYLDEIHLASPLGDTIRIPLVLPYVTLAAGLRQIYKLVYIERGTVPHKAFLAIWTSKAVLWLSAFVYCLYWNHMHLETTDYGVDMILREAFNFFPFLCASYLVEFLLRVSVSRKVEPLKKSTPFPQLLRWASRLIHFNWNPKNKIIHYIFCFFKGFIWGSVILGLLNSLRFDFFVAPWDGMSTVWSILCLNGHTLLVNNLVPLAILSMVEWLFFDRPVFATETDIV